MHRLLTTSISVFEWPILHTMHPFFILSMYSLVTTFLLPGEHNDSNTGSQGTVTTGTTAVLSREAIVLDWDSARPYKYTQQQSLVLIGQHWCYVEANITDSVANRPTSSAAKTTLHCNYNRLWKLHTFTVQHLNGAH